MSDIEDPTARTKPVGAPVSTSPSQSARAHPLDPDIMPWEKQPGETKDAYDAFTEYRDSDARRIGDKTYWSSVWSWGYRVHEWDKYLAAVDVKEMVRYRRTMNERQRVVARVAQNKVAEWLQNVNVSSLKPADVARFWDIAVRIERTASGADPLLESALNRDTDGDRPDDATSTLRDVMGDLDLDESDLARSLHAALTQAARDQ